MGVIDPPFTPPQYIEDTEDTEEGGIEKTKKIATHRFACRVLIALTEARGGSVKLQGERQLGKFPCGNIGDGLGACERKCASTGMCRV